MVTRIFSDGVISTKVRAAENVFVSRVVFRSFLPGLGFRVVMFRSFFVALHKTTSAGVLIDELKEL